MPAYTKSIGTSEIVLVDGNDKRTCLCLANPDAAAIFYIYDTQGVGTSGFPLFPQTYIVLARYENMEIEKKLWAISSAAGKTIHIWEHFRKADMPPQEPVDDIQEPEAVKDPFM